MMHGLSNKLFCFISCFFNKTKQFQREKSALQGFNHLNKYKDIEVLLDPVLHTMAMALKIQMHTLYPCQYTHTRSHTHVHTHVHTHGNTHVQPQSVSYCPYCTNITTLIFPPRATDTHTEAEQATLEI